MYCVIEYHFHNATTYDKRKHYSRSVQATSLTEEGARRWYEEEHNKRSGERRWREGDNWFSYRSMWITEVRLEQL